MIELAFVVAAGLFAGPQEDSRKLVEELKAKVAAAKTPHEKALAIRAMGDAEPKDAVLAAAIGKYLAPCPADLASLMPSTAADALGRFRGSAAAARVLQSALPGFRKNPSVYQRILQSLGRVGHESSIPVFEEAMHGTDADQAVAAVRVLGDFPAAAALESLFREWETFEKRKASASDDQKKVLDRLQPEVLKSIRRLSGQNYPSLQEMTLWWKRHGAEFKEEAAKRERERTAAPGGVATGPLPPALLVELSFRENMGNTTSNTGVSTVAFPTASIAGAKWTAQAAINAGPAALEWDKAGGTQAVDLGGGAGVDALRGLRSFTVTGWILVTDAREGAAGKPAGAGNRIVSWLNPSKEPDGVEIVRRADGSLQVGINQWADQSAARSPGGQIPVVDAKAKDPGQAALDAWRFFAVTYDSGLAAGNVKIYLGSWNGDAKLVSSHDGDRGHSGARIAPLTVGHVAALIRPLAADRAFRGTIDEIRVFGSVADGSGALPLPEILRIQNRTVPAP